MLKMNDVLITILLTGLIGFSTGVAAPLTDEQGDAILKELRQIREILERVEQSGQASARRSAVQEPASNAQVSVEGLPSLGDPSAPLTLVEFTDYQCPYCERFYATTLPEIKRDYIDTGTLKLIVKDLPLPFHAQALAAAAAARCAGAQGQFWPMHNLLFENGGQFDAASLQLYATQLELDSEKFVTCREQNRFSAQIAGDQAEAKSQGIAGTPTFILGIAEDGILSGKVIRGAQPFESFKKEIDRLIAVGAD